MMNAKPPAMRRARSEHEPSCDAIIIDGVNVVLAST